MDNFQIIYGEEKIMPCRGLFGNHTNIIVCYLWDPNNGYHINTLYKPRLKSKDQFTVLSSHLYIYLDFTCAQPIDCICHLPRGLLY